MKKKLVLGLIVFILRCSVCAQTIDNVLIDSIVESITKMQVKDSGEFLPGMFSGYRGCAGWPHNYQPDNNIFFTAISAFSLRNMYSSLSISNQKKIDLVLENIPKSYPHFQNKQGDPFYYFWPQNSPIMPHSLVARHFDGLVSVGEDADDAVMILMSMNAKDSICRVLKKRMIETSNLSNSKRRISSSLKRYRAIPAYSTYLGLKMPPDFDFAVQCNMLYFTMDREMPLVLQDSATIEILGQMIRERLYMKKPIFISPCYAKSSVLLYHITRLIHAFSIPELSIYKTQLEEDITHLLHTSDNIMDRIILSTSLLRLGKIPEPIDLSNLASFENTNQSEFVFFQARAAFCFPPILKKLFLRCNYLNFNFYCPTYNKILLLEYLVNYNAIKKSGVVLK
jgi:hypothetical protein